MNSIMTQLHNIHKPYHEVCQMLHPKSDTPQVPQKTFVESYFQTDIHSYCLYAKLQNISYIPKETEYFLTTP